ncbi:MAG: dual specificity protein phosphatase family protein [Dehalogenimonas sp.]
MKGSQGIERVCCLLEDPGALLNDYSLAFGQNNVKHTPICDFRYSTEENLLSQIIPFLQDSTEKNQRVLVHWGAGNGRTGHVLAAWLCYKYDYEPENAISAILKSGRNPREAPMGYGFGTEEKLQRLLRKSREMGKKRRDSKGPRNESATTETGTLRA